jgi:hypothetical protein
VGHAILVPQLRQKISVLAREAWHVGHVEIGVTCVFAERTSVFGISSLVNAQTSDTTQPTNVHPRSRFRAKIAPALRFRSPIIVGKKYTANPKTTGTIKNPIVPPRNLLSS